uniref:Replication initiator protein n=1 Tax=Dulem virus 106 TaxID=3145583 RepID=A0AAU8B6Y6_9VIRU
MACYHPLVGIADGINPGTGKTHYKILPYNEKYFTDAYYKDKVVTIPCGQCVGCRLAYSREWANRCMMELEYHDSAYFVTLTYNDDHLPRSYYPDQETGEALPSFTLNKRDCQLFMKRLRKAKPDDHIRFFLAGEYGDQTFRPHYHAIIFGLHLDDLVLYKKSPQGFLYYNSPCIQRAWSTVVTRENSITPLAVPIGYAVVAEVTWETCAYTARYVMKKLKGADVEFYRKFNIEPPFTLMSRKPGIGRQWYDDHPGLYDYDFINLSTKDGGRKFRPPKYFNRLYDVEYPDKSAELKAFRRAAAEAQKELKLQKTNLSYLDLLAVEEQALKDRIKPLERKL